MTERRSFLGSLLAAPLALLGWKPKPKQILVIDEQPDFLPIVGECEGHVIQDTIRDLPSFEEIKNSLRWGTYGKDGCQPLTYKRLVDCDTEHLQAILQTQPHVRGNEYEYVIKAILNDRGETPEEFSLQACEAWYNRLCEQEDQSWRTNIQPGFMIRRDKFT